MLWKVTLIVYPIKDNLSLHQRCDEFWFLQIGNQFAMSANAPERKVLNHSFVGVMHLQKDQFAMKY